LHNINSLRRRTIMVTLVGRSGSLRRSSYNSALLRAAAAMMPADSGRLKAATGKNVEEKRN
jgi:hypothetical protein